MQITTTSIWEDLEREGRHLARPAERLYRALGTSAIGIRAGYLPDQNILELLIEIPCEWAGDSVIPEWRGMGHEVTALRLPPREKAHHLRLFLTDPEHRDVFLTVCEDLVEALEGISEASQRVRELEACLLRWRRFFERSGLKGLSVESQQGLFAELTWLQLLLQAGVDPLMAVSAWKGCERGYHDFDLKGHVVEVKSTQTKEPRGVIINNERQLDDKGLRSLHLFVLSVYEVEAGGITLPEQVEIVRSGLSIAPIALASFRKGLISTGYLDHDTERYRRNLVVKGEDVYQVVEGFPRITTLPPGVSNLRYGVLLAACEPFRVCLLDYLTTLTEI